MLDLNNLVVNRVIIQTIIAKKDGHDSATVKPSDEIIEINHDALEIIRTRLIDAAGKNSKAFELEVENDNPYSFFSYAKDLHELDDTDFVRRTVDIAELLADSQKRTTIPGGYLLILDCLDNETSLSVTIAIKAEPHEALQFTIDDGQSQLNVLKKVFLSPSQKLYKIGILYHLLPDDKDDLKANYGCFLYDDQFRADSHPAEYFYKDFLGFSIGRNAKIQSQRFFEKTKHFIISKVTNLETKKSLFSALKNEFNISQAPTVNPDLFGRAFIPSTGGLRDSYLADVCHELPSAIVKDSTLIKFQLDKRKIDFPSDIKLSGPEVSFDNRVEIIDETTELQSLDALSAEYTILKIKGKPYSTGE